MNDIRYWTTSHVEASNQLDYWIGAICEVFLEMGCVPRGSTSFSGSIASLQVGELTFNRVNASPQDVLRTRREIARSTALPFYLISQASTSWQIKQGSRSDRLRAGDAVLVDSAQPYELQFPDASSCLSVELPRAWLASWLVQPECDGARVIPRDVGWGQALSGFCMQLCSDLRDANRFPAGALTEHLGAMLAVALEPAVQGGSDSARLELFRRVEDLILMRLDEFGLTASDVAAALGISLRTLHRTFAAHGLTVMGHLRTLRIRRAEKLLAQPRFSRLAASEIGRRCGYSDPSHFTRDFHKVTGLTPARWRRHGSRP